MTKWPCSLEATASTAARTAASPARRPRSQLHRTVRAGWWMVCGLPKRVCWWLAQGGGRREPAEQAGHAQEKGLKANLG